MLIDSLFLNYPTLNSPPSPPCLFLLLQYPFLFLYNHVIYFPFFETPPLFLVSYFIPNHCSYVDCSTYFEGLKYNTHRKNKVFSFLGLHYLTQDYFLLNPINFTYRFNNLILLIAELYSLYKYNIFLLFIYPLMNI